VNDWTEASLLAKAQGVVSPIPAGLYMAERYKLRGRIVNLIKEITDPLLEKLAYYEAPLPLGKGNCYHRFTDEGICVRCGEDAEEWDAGCVEEIVEDLKSVVHPDFVNALESLEANLTGDDIDVVRLYLPKIRAFSKQFKWDEPEEEDPPLNNWPDNFEITL